MILPPKYSTSNKWRCIFGRKWCHTTHPRPLLERNLSLSRQFVRNGVASVSPFFSGPGLLYSTHPKTHLLFCRWSTANQKIMVIPQEIFLLETQNCWKVTNPPHHSSYDHFIPKHYRSQKKPLSSGHVFTIPRKVTSRILGKVAEWPIILKPEWSGRFGDSSLTFHHHLGEFPTGGEWSKNNLQKKTTTTFSRWGFTFSIKKFTCFCQKRIARGCNNPTDGISPRTPPEVKQFAPESHEKLEDDPVSFVRFGRFSNR